MVAISNVVIYSYYFSRFFIVYRALVGCALCLYVFYILLLCAHRPSYMGFIA